MYSQPFGDIEQVAYHHADQPRAVPSEHQLPAGRRRMRTRTARTLRRLAAAVDPAT